MSTMNQRIAACIQASGLTKTAFAEKLGVTQPFVSKLCSGTSTPSDRTLRDISDKFHINEQWLRTGEGDMMRTPDPDEELARFFASVTFGGDSVQKRFLTALSRLNEEEWKALESLTQKLTDQSS